MSVEQTLREIRKVREIPRRYGKKGKNQSKKEILIQKSKGLCTYCQNKFRKHQLCFIRKNHSLQEGQIYEPQNNHVIACQECASKKSMMDHIEFLKYIQEEKRTRRQEIADNYPTYATKVFEKYNGKCIYCEFEFGKTPAGVKLTIDHKTAISRLGDNNEKNLASSCHKHNKEKDTLSAHEYFRFLEKTGRKYNLTKKK